MNNDLKIRLQTDRAFVEYLCRATGESASALANKAKLAATTLNRFLRDTPTTQSTLKDSSIQKVATRFNLDYLVLTNYKKRIEQALRHGKPIPAPPENKDLSGFGESSAPVFATPERNPLMDRIMGATYDAWFQSDYRDMIPFNRLPNIVHLLYRRATSDKKPPPSNEIKKRAADMLAVMAMDGKKK